ncbi:putative oxidoreductase, FAD-binding [Aspergillus clavatus NRRL 1]|uniref:Oxidoreductase, FAD-binding, putative n=1 Tax=Aspergillus clavatus (strain ATCC 1007 / CBS 513.65 / DSM 816 / NCTC 3887 / NRRL 1 / QM 1276 / 107) TaxID=344612 RepID=A1CT49_ASPCL|nr:oxidoreductase, FAD-binding, putative [Aspergillus clavatus NRRL 1]EAW06486.1 oxidoreductase, FAD-binding, putative [Aspergillus clavatus NRRL 1]
MDTNFRGGPPGFVRIVSNGPSGAIFVYPEYSGNRLYQTLGNFLTTPLAGYVFPDFETGDALYITGHTQILVGKDAATMLPRSNLAVKVTITAARYVKRSLAFRGIAGAPSPYNPSVRYLTTEKAIPAADLDEGHSVIATLVKKEILSPNIGRFRFRISDPSRVGAWSPGQYATFSFQEELDMGYRHMHDEDPSSLNDDYVRTFTVSSYPGHSLTPNEFEITVRKHGNVTSHLFRINERAGLEVPLKGFGGEFKLEDQGDSSKFPFIAGGIGITPVIAQLPGVDTSRLHLMWSVSVQDVGFVLDTFKRFPQLPASTTLFLTGPEPKGEKELLQLATVLASAARVERRRMEARDVDLSLSDVWYFCGSSSLKSSAMAWLEGKQVVYEDFSY